MTDRLQRLQSMIPGRETAPENTESPEPGSDEWWDAHMRDKVRLWHASDPEDPHDTGALAESLGMTFGEFADWFSSGIVAERVKRVWTRRS